MQAIYITNGGFDAVVVQDGTALMVDHEVMKHFLAAQQNGDDFSEWHGTMDWPAGVDDIWEAAERMGNIVAYYEDGQLYVRDEQVWQKRKEFWGFG